MRIAWFDCFSGISGDMTLGALVSAGWPAGEAQSLPGRLGLEGVRVGVRDVRRGPLAAIQVEVVVEASQQPQRHLRHVEEVLARADLPAAVRERSLAVFRRLAGAEAEVHGTSVEQVHFHEVGAADALVDVAGALLGLDQLGIARVHASPPRLGRGSVRSEHGLIPVPAPATLALLEGVPVFGGPELGETVTPTGAALVRTLADEFGPLPLFTLEKTGVGLGDRRLAGRPNLLRLITGEAGPGQETVVELSANLDDFPAERFAYLMEQLFAAGALDVAALPAQMKKNRPGTLLQVLARPADRPAVIRALLLHSTTLGVRYREMFRTALPRRIETVATRFGPARVKWARRPDGAETPHPEADDLYRLARKSGRPLAEIEAEVLRRLRGRRARPKPAKS